jgi:hypothetical protein
MATQLQADWVQRLRDKGYLIRKATQSTGFPAPANRRQASRLVAFWRRTIRRLSGNAPLP